MAIENINSVQPMINNVVENEVKQEELQSTPQSKGSSKDVIAVLASLAAIGAAGVAIYKHKSAKQAIEKAEQEAKKKIEAAEEKAKKAADEVEKKVQEAVDKAKKEFEETNGKTKKPETDAPKTPSDSPKSPSDKTPKPVTSAPTSSIPVSTPVSGEKKPSLWARFKGLFKRKPKSTRPKAPKFTSESTTIFRPVTLRKPKAASASTPGATPSPAGVTADDKPSFMDRVKKFLSRKDKKPKRHSEDTEPKAPTAPTAAPTAAETPTSIVEPKPVSAGSPVVEPKVEPFTAPKPSAEPIEAEEEGIIEIALEEKPSAWARFKNMFKRKPKAPKTPEAAPIEVGSPTPIVEPKPVSAGSPVVEPKVEPIAAPKSAAEPVGAEEEEILDIAFEEKPSAWARFKNMFKRKPKAPKAPEAAPIEVGSPTPIVEPKPVSAGSPVVEPKVEPIAAPKSAAEPVVAEEEEIFEIALEEKPSAWARFKNMFKRKPKAPKAPEAAPIEVGSPTPIVEPKPVSAGSPVVEPKVEPILEEAFIINPSEEFLVKLPDFTKFSEETLIAEYNSLNKVVQGLPVLDPTAQRFMAIKGELFNHRGYRIQNGKLVKILPEPKLSEVFKGIKMPDVTTISEQNLLMEYNALKGIVKDLPVADPTSQRFMAIRGELFNHRGYRIQNGKLVKILPEPKPSEALGINAKKKSPYIKPEMTVKPLEQKPAVPKAEPKIEPKAEEVKADVKPVEVKPAVLKAEPKIEPKAEEVKADVKPVEVKPAVLKAEPKIEPKAEEVKTDVKPAEVKPVVQKAANLVDRSMPEFKGLTEEEALQLEYANCKYCAESLFKFMDFKQEPYKARMVEIEAELKNLGKEVNASVFEDEVMATRLKTVNQRVAVADQIVSLTEHKEEFAKATAKLHEAGFDGVAQTPVEMDLQGRYIYYTKMQKEYGFYADNVESAIAKLEEKGFKPFEVVTEKDKVIADYMEAYHFKIIAESNFNRKEKELAYLEEQLSEVLSKEGSKKK